jgi:N-acetylmuramoyl-L-alanine amidase
MKRILLISTLLLSFTLVLTPVFASTSSLAGKVIVLDAGHGGSDPGTIECSYITEAEANLDIAERLKALLEDAGATVVMTRISNDQTLSNEDRYTLANDSNGDALVSIHLNGSTDHSKNGTLGLYAKIKKDKAFTEVLHSVLADTLGVEDMGVTNFMSGVTLKSDMPATIQESVYLSNTEECEAIGNSDGSRQQEIAAAVFEGLENWFDVPIEWTPPGKSRRSK